MAVRAVGVALVWCGALAGAVYGQQRGRGDGPGATPPRPEPGRGAITNAVEREVQGLTAADFPERQAALRRLQGLIADQMRQRAEVQEIVNLLLADLGKQQHALAMVSDEEAQAQIAGLLELERGLAGWTIQTMAEPAERRRELLAWGLSREAAATAARVYAPGKRMRLEGIKQLAKMDEAGASWTLSRLINDADGAVRAAAMAVAWRRKPSADVVAALWFRAIAGPWTLAEQELRGRVMDDGANNLLKVEFPEGEPMEFAEDDSAGEYSDALLAADVLVHLKSPLVEERVKALVADRIKAGKHLTAQTDPEWTLAAHRLVEAYSVKEAIPILAAEAVGRESEEMGGDMNGRPYVWSQRTMAIGVLATLVGQDPANFGLFRAHDGSDLRGWTWAADLGGPGLGARPGAGDGAAVRAFYKWWKDHHAEYGVKEEPSAAGVPPEPRGRGGRGGGFGGVRGGPAVDVMPEPAPEQVEPPVAPQPRPRILPAPANPE